MQIQDTARIPGTLTSSRREALLLLAAPSRRERLTARHYQSYLGVNWIVVDVRGSEDTISRCEFLMTSSCDPIRCVLCFILALGLAKPCRQRDTRSVISVQPKAHRATTLVYDEPQR